MNNMELALMGLAAVALVVVAILIYREVNILKKHNQNTIDHITNTAANLKDHVTNMASALSTVIKAAPVPSAKTASPAITVNSPHPTTVTVDGSNITVSAPAAPVAVIPAPPVKPESPSTPTGSGPTA